MVRPASSFGKERTSVAYTVLIVDSELMVRRSLALLLETHGFQVAMARNAPQAMTAFPNVDPDAVLMELGVAEAGGVETIEEMRRLKPSAKIIGMDQKDSFAERDLLRTGNKLGADALLAKPFEAEDVLHVPRDQLLPECHIPELAVA